MGKKKKQRKQDGNQTQRSNSRPTVLGIDAQELGAAIAMAVVGEIAQIAINRTMKSLHASDSISSAGTSTQNSVQTAAISVKDALRDAHPVMQEAIATLKELIEDITPSIRRLLESMRELPQDKNHSLEKVADVAKTLTREAVHALSHRAADTANQAGNGVREEGRSLSSSMGSSMSTAVGAVKTVFDDFKASGSDHTSNGLTHQKKVDKKKRKKKKK